MSSPAAAKNRPLAPDDPALNPGWSLLDFLLSLRADEFTVRFLYAADANDDCERLASRLAFATLGERVRECTVTNERESNPRAVDVWRLDGNSISALREIMSTGLPESGSSMRAWAEDLCVYRDGKLLFGMVTHEHFAFLRLSDEEWRRWEQYAA